MSNGQEEEEERIYVGGIDPDRLTLSAVADRLRAVKGVDVLSVETTGGGKLGGDDNGRTYFFLTARAVRSPSSSSPQTSSSSPASSPSTALAALSRAYNNVTWRGCTIKVERARPHFLERLMMEQEERTTKEEERRRRRECAAVAADADGVAADHNTDGTAAATATAGQAPPRNLRIRRRHGEEAFRVDTRPVDAGALNNSSSSGKKRKRPAGNRVVDADQAAAWDAFGEVLTSLNRKRSKHSDKYAEQRRKMRRIAKGRGGPRDKRKDSMEEDVGSPNGKVYLNRAVHLRFVDVDDDGAAEGADGANRRGAVGRSSENGTDEHYETDDIDHDGARFMTDGEYAASDEQSTGSSGSSSSDGGGAASEPEGAGVEGDDEGSVGGGRYVWSDSDGSDGEEEDESKEEGGGQNDDEPPTSGESSVSMHEEGAEAAMGGEADAGMVQVEAEEEEKEVLSSESDGEAVFQFPSGFVFPRESPTPREERVVPVDDDVDRGDDQQEEKEKEDEEEIAAAAAAAVAMGEKEEEDEVVSSESSDGGDGGSEGASSPGEPRGSDHDNRNDQNGKGEITNRKPMRHDDVFGEQVSEQMEVEEGGRDGGGKDNFSSGRVIDVAASRRLVGRALGVRMPNSNASNGKRGEGGAGKLGSEEETGRDDGEERGQAPAIDDDDDDDRSSDGASESEDSDRPPSSSKKYAWSDDEDDDDSDNGSGDSSSDRRGGGGVRPPASQQKLLREAAVGAYDEFSAAVDYRDEGEGAAGDENEDEYEGSDSEENEPSPSVDLGGDVASNLHVLAELFPDMAGTKPKAVAQRGDDANGESGNNDGMGGAGQQQQQQQQRRPGWGTNGLMQRYDPTDARSAKRYEVAKEKIVTIATTSTLVDKDEPDQDQDDRGRQGEGGGGGDNADREDSALKSGESRSEEEEGSDGESRGSAVSAIRDEGRYGGTSSGGTPGVENEKKPIYEQQKLEGIFQEAHSSGGVVGAGGGFRISQQFLAELGGEGSRGNDAAKPSDDMKGGNVGGGQRGSQPFSFAFDVGGGTGMAEEKATGGSTVEGAFSFAFDVSGKGSAPALSQEALATAGKDATKHDEGTSVVSGTVDATKDQYRSEEQKPLVGRNRRKGMMFPKDVLDDLERSFFEMNDGRRVLEDHEGMRDDEASQSAWMEERKALTLDWRRKQKHATSRKEKKMKYWRK